MATSGSYTFDKNSNSDVGLKFTWSRTNVSGRKSVISYTFTGVKVRGSLNNPYSTMYRCRLAWTNTTNSTSGDGWKNLYTRDTEMTLYANTSLASGTFEVEHNANGDASFQINIMGAIYSSSASEIWNSYTLDNIGKQTYTIYFDEQGGTSVSDKTVSQGSAVGALPTPTKTGHSFVGWYDSTSGGTKWASTTIMPSHNVTLYARWSANTYTVTYTPNGGSGSNQTQQVIYGQNWTAKGSLFTRIGHTQTSWNASPNGSGEVFTFDLWQGAWTRTSDLTLYAQWVVNSYTDTFNLNGGDSGGGTFSVNYGATYVVPTATRKGYNFLGWFTASSGGSKVYNGGETVTQDTTNNTYYAQWELASNCYIKQNGVYKQAMMFIKQNGVYKKVSIYVKDKGTYKKNK